MFGGLGLTAAAKYEGMIKSLQWDGLRSLWHKIESRNTPEWDAGKAFEYMVLRAFELDGADVKWPYRVKLFGKTLSKLMVLFIALVCLV